MGHFPFILYRWGVSPVLHGLFGAPAGCRFWPTCSQYAEEALRTHGALRGSWLTARRLAKCHPFSRGGIAPVPPCDIASSRKVSANGS